MDRVEIVCISVGINGHFRQSVTDQELLNLFSLARIEICPYTIHLFVSRVSYSSNYIGVTIDDGPTVLITQSPKLMNRIKRHTTDCAKSVIRWLYATPWRRRSQCHCHYALLKHHDVSLNDLLYIRSKLFALSLSKLHSMYNSWLIKPVANTNSNRYKLTSIPCTSQTCQTFWQ